MKVTIEIDCSPEEARRALGLPDLTPLHDAFLARAREAMQAQNPAADVIAGLVKSWGPAGDGAMDFWRRFRPDDAGPQRDP